MHYGLPCEVAHIHIQPKHPLHFILTTLKFNLINKELARIKPILAGVEIYYLWRKGLSFTVGENPHRAKFFVSFFDKLFGRVVDQRL